MSVDEYDVLWKVDKTLPSIVRGFRPEGSIVISFTVVLIGDSGVGKSNILSRYSRDEFMLENKPTIGVEFAAKTVELGGETVKVQIWDTAGQEVFRAVTAVYYRGALGAVLAYDITRYATFQHCDYWLKEMRQYTPDNTPVILVGNKADLRHLRDVSTEEAANYAEREGIYFMETSALESTNIEEAFQELLQGIWDRTRSHLADDSDTNGDPMDNRKTTPIVFGEAEKSSPVVNLSNGPHNSDKPGIKKPDCCK